MKTKILFTLLIVFMFSFAGCSSYITLTPQPEYHKISVSGQADFETMPDQALFDVQVESQAKTATEASALNSKAIENVMDALKSAGIKASDIETTNYNVYPWKRWEQRTGKEILEGYKAYHTLKVKTKDIEEVGTYLDAAVKAGATNIHNIRFDFSKAKEREVNDEALKLAVSNAEEKAQTLADTLGVSVGKVVSVSESNFVSQPYYARAMGGMEMEDMEMVKTEIAPKQVTTRASVQVSFLIE